MRRRGDRTPKEEEGERKGEQSAEEYQCTGVLELDFPELCARAGVTGVPKVTPRPSPSFPADDEPEEPGLGGVLARIHHKYRPLQPRLEVEGDPQDPRTARAIFLRGWKLEEEVLGVFSRCLPSLAGLQALQTFSLEGTPVPEAALPTLMGSNSTLSHLSLRCSQLGDAAAQLLGGLLSTPSGPPARLVSLVLSFNRISDLGVSYIAKGLRLNRSLLSLSLANNDIGDSGATSLAEVLGPFPLTHQEVVQRRRLLLALGRPLTTLKDQKERTQSLRGVPDRLLPGKLGKTTPKKKEPPRKEETRQPKKAPEPRPARGKEPKPSGQEKPEVPDPLENPQPLLEEVREEPGGSLVLSGNRALLNLNLSHNHISERGLAAFLAALEQQQQQQQQQEGSGRGGLRSLSLGGNRIPPTSQALGRLRELLPWDPQSLGGQDQEEEEQDLGT
ncbi:leucine-rich repeat-containing protein 71 isoform X3 [Heliangelus exortis]|uniref:leucine-rich repeat-containing protein 71 isoform X3 n=1 Tax=Heliangelus exortis TaxID=472823 RepID=UPI003A8DEEEE